MDSGRVPDNIRVLRERMNHRVHPFFLPFIQLTVLGVAKGYTFILE
nr:MAG TPA: hypothetical protein [Caudoviricetes sp.]